MRSHGVVLALAAVMARTTVAQTVTQSPPFSLKITSSTNATLDGQYLVACHAGAAIEGLCLGGTASASGEGTFYFYFNQTDYGSGPSPTGTLVWNLPYTGPDGPATESEPLIFQISNLGSNVVVPLFQPGYPTAPDLGFDSDSKMYISAWDDSTLVSGQWPTTTTTIQLYNWYICYAETGGYFYNSLAWVLSGEPHNPTCQSVGVVRA